MADKVIKRIAIFILAVTTMTGSGWVTPAWAAFITSGTSQWSNVNGGINYGAGNVGIGTTNPNRLLNLSSTNSSFLNLQITQNNSSHIQNADEYGIEFSTNDADWQAAKPVVHSSIGVIPVLNAYGNYYDMAFRTGYTASAVDHANIEALRIKYNGNVGVGTNDPKQKLHINGNLVLSSGSQDIGWAYGEVLQIGQYNSDYSAYTERMRVDTVGNVGIGSTTPVAKLAVSGGTGNVIYAGGGQIAGLNSTPINSDQAVPLGYLQANYTPSGTAAGGVGNGTTGQTLRHNGTSWIANSTLYNNGTNVGIGTTNPVSGKLQVSTATNASSMTLGSNTGIAFSVKKADEGYGLHVGVAGSGTSWIQSGSTSGATAYDLSLQASGGNVLFPGSGIWNSSGNVGIGTTAPTQKLTVNGEINRPFSWRLTNAWGNDTLTIKKNAWDGSSNNNYGGLAAGKGYFYNGLQSGGSTGNEAGDGQLYVNSISMLMGNVGIGSTTPVAKLAVSGGTGNVIYAGGGQISGLNSTPTNSDHAVPLGYLQSNYAPIGTGAGSAFVQGGNSFGTAASLGTNDNNLLNIETNNAVRMTVAANGNVGIGTTNPRAFLEVGANNGVNASIVAGNIIELAGQSDVAQAAEITITGGTLVFGGPTAKNGRGYWNITSFPSTITFNTRGWWTYAGMSFTAENVHNYPAGGGNKLPGSFLVEASSDGVNWTIVDDVTNYTSALYYKDSIYGGSGSWVRVTARAPQSGETTAKLANVQIFNGKRSGKNPFSLSAEGNAVFIGGNIGLDTIKPNSKLAITGNAAIGATYGSLSAPTSGLIIEGNVGIGTTGPMEKLDVAGNVMLNRNNLSWSREQYNFASSTVRANINPFSIKIWDNYTGASAPTTYGTLLDIYGYSGHEQSQLYFGSDGSIRYRDAFYSETSFSPWSTLLLSTTDVNSSGNLRITGAGVHYISTGNVGISTTSPVTKLAVSGGTGNVIYAGGGQISGLNSTPTNSDHAVPLGYLQSNYTPSGTASGGVGNGTTGQTLRHNGTSWVANSTLFNNGTNVGIGTTAPEAALEVIGRLNIGDFINNSVGNLQVKGTGAGNGVTVWNEDVGVTWRMWIDGPNNMGYLTRGSSPTAGIGINDVGNVGIGTTAPSSPLHVYSYKPAIPANTYGSFFNFSHTDAVNGLEVAAVYAKSDFAGGANPLNSGLIGEANFTGNYGSGYFAGVLGRANYNNNSAGLYLTGTKLMGLRGEVAILGTGNNTIPYGYGLYTTGSVASGSTLTNYYGAYLAAPSGTITNTYALVTEAGAGNVGIGTVSPIARLEVNGNAVLRNTLSIYSIEAGQTDRRLSINPNTADTFLIYNYDEGAGTFHDIQLGGSSVIGSGLVAKGNGNVGIGSTTPVAKLAVSGGAGNVIYAGGGQIAGLNSTPTNSDHAVPLGYLQANYTPSGTASGGVGNGTTGQTLRHNGTSWVANSVLFNNGTNVGIGTTNPGLYKLNVAGDQYVSGYLVSPNIMSGVVYAESATLARALNEPGGWVKIWDSGGGSAYTTNFRITGGYDNRYNNLEFRVTTSGYGQPHSIVMLPTTAYNSGTIEEIRTQNVSNTQLEVWVKLSAVGSLYTGSITVHASDAGLVSPLSFTTTQPTWGTKSVAVYPQQDMSNLPMQFSSPIRSFGTGANYFSGNVGIGTTNPISSLHIKKTGTPTITLEDSSGGTQTAQIIYNQGGANNLDIKTNYVSVSNRISLIPGGVTALSALGSGNVGIGSTTPVAKLAVSGGTGNVIYTGGGQVAGLNSTPTNSDHAVPLGYLQANYSPASSSLWGGTQNGNIYNGTNGSGNVGVGVTNPSAKLQVHGNLKINSNAPLVSRNIFSIARTIAVGAGSWVNLGTLTSNGQGTYATIYQSNHHTGSINAAVYEISDVYYSGLTTDWVQVPTSNYRSYTGLQDYTIDVRRTADHGTANLEIRARALTSSGAGTLTFEIQTNGTFTDSTTSGTGATVAGYLGHNAYQFPISNNRFAASSEGIFMLNTGNVGIGSTTPVAKLAVSGGSGNVIYAGGGQIAGLNSTPINSDQAVPLGYLQANYTPSGTASGGVGNGTTGQTLRHNGTSWIANSTLYNNGTNVGIGTTTPGTKLTIAGGDDASGVGVLELRTTGGTNLKFGGNNTYSWIQSHASKPLYINSLGNNVIFNSGGGNVGIGTTNPGQKLHVSGKIYIDSYSNNLLIGANSALSSVHKVTPSAIIHGNPAGNTPNFSSASLAILDYRDTTTSFGSSGFGPNGIYLGHSRSGTIGTPGTIVQNGDVLGALYFLGDDGTDFRSVGAYIGAQVDGTPGSNDMPGKLVFATTPDGSQDSIERMTIISTGSVGIGTTTPGKKLDVLGDFRSSGPDVVATINATSGYGARMDFQNNGVSKVYTGVVAINNWGGLPTGTSINDGFTRFDGGKYVFTTSGSHIMSLLSNGNVGISTTSPVAKLAVSGGTGNVIYAGGGQVAGLNSTPTNSDHAVPLGYLQANYSPASSSLWGGTQNGNIYNGTNGSGNVGIGTTAPGNSLHIKGHNVINNRGYFQLTLEDSASDYPGLYFKGSSGNHGYIRSEGGDGFSITTVNSSTNTNNDAVRITEAGNVGIGTTNPGNYRLKVAGNMAVTGTFETQTGSDFAEEFRTDRELEAGTVVVMGDLGYKSAKLSDKKHDKTVIGIVSDNPSIIAGRVDISENEHKAIVAMAGVVTVKVSDVNGKIVRGDLLASSDIPGYAMKTNGLMPGTVIGKALESLTGHRGEIKVLVNLQ